MYTVTLEQNNGLKNILKHSLEILLDIEDKICWGQFSCLEEITSFIIVDYTTTLRGNCYLFSFWILGLNGFTAIGLKMGSDKIIYWRGRYSFFLGFIMSERHERFCIELLNIKPQTLFLCNKTQKERVCTESINILIWTLL